MCERGSESVMCANTFPDEQPVSASLLGVVDCQMCHDLSYKMSRQEASHV
jgi:hypothetical protein